MSGSKPGLHGLFELVLEVTDLEGSVTFYRDRLGMAVVERWPEPRPGVWMAMGENEVLGLWPRASGGPGVGLYGSRGGSHVHFALFVEPGTFEQWLTALQADGVPVHGPNDFGASGNRSLYVDDPDGNVVELAEWSVDWSGRPVTKTSG